MTTENMTTATTTISPAQAEAAKRTAADKRANAQAAKPKAAKPKAAKAAKPAAVTATPAPAAKAAKPAADDATRSRATAAEARAVLSAHALALRSDGKLDPADAVRVTLLEMPRGVRAAAVRRATTAGGADGFAACARDVLDAKNADGSHVVPHDVTKKGGRSSSTFAAGDVRTFAVYHDKRGNGVVNVIVPMADDMLLGKRVEVTANGDGSLTVRVVESYDARPYPKTN